MSSLNVHILTSLEQVLRAADPWNDLWRRSRVTLPTSRAEFQPLWVEQFAAGQKFQAVVVEDANQWVAALPLVGQRWARVVRAGTVPRNDWLLAGNLLLDENMDCRHALRLLAETLNKLPYTLYRFTEVPSHDTSWQHFHAALLDARLQIESRPSFDVVRVAIGSDWESYQQSWSKNHRKNMARTMRRLEEQGSVRVRRWVPQDHDGVAATFQRAFQIEDSGWKGESGSSILRTPGMPQFMTKLGGLLAERGELEVAFLELNQQPLAFEILWNAKRTLHSYKVGYDEQFRQVNPGQILMQELLRDLFESRRCDAYDCIGPVSPATEKWCGDKYPMSQWTVAPRKSLSRALLFAYQNLRTPPPRPLTIIGESANNAGDEAPSRPADEHHTTNR